MQHTILKEGKPNIVVTFKKTFLLVTNQSGDVAEEIFYLPYGGLLDGNSDERFQYTGQEKDKETGFQYYGARYYDSDFRRFLQPDPIIADIYDPQNLNRYSYVLNNPYKYVDPSGNFVDTVADVAFIGYDIYAIIKNPEDSSNYLALAADVVGAVVPGLTGFGVAVKAAKNADKIGDAAKAITKTDDTIDAVRGAEKGVDGVTSAGGVSDSGKALQSEIAQMEEKFDNVRFGRGGLAEKNLDAVRTEKRGGIVNIRKDGKPGNHIRKFEDSVRSVIKQVERIKSKLRHSLLTRSERLEFERLLSERSNFLDELRKRGFK